MSVTATFISVGPVSFSDNFNLSTTPSYTLPLGSPILATVIVSGQPSVYGFIQSFVSALLDDMTLLGSLGTQQTNAATLGNWNARRNTLLSHNGNVSLSSTGYSLPYFTEQSCSSLDKFIQYEMKLKVPRTSAKIDKCRMTFGLIWSLVSTLIQPLYDTSTILLDKNPKWSRYIGNLTNSSASDAFFATNSAIMMYAIDDTSKFAPTDAALQLWQQFATSNVGDKVVCVLSGLNVRSDVPIRPKCDADTNSQYSGYFGVEILHAN
jgi:hypothetical protein